MCLSLINLTMEIIFIRMGIWVVWASKVSLFGEFIALELWDLSDPYPTRNQLPRSNINCFEPCSSQLVLGSNCPLKPIYTLEFHCFLIWQSGKNWPSCVLVSSRYTECSFLCYGTSCLGNFWIPGNSGISKCSFILEHLEFLLKSKDGEISKFLKVIWDNGIWKCLGRNIAIASDRGYAVTSYPKIPGEIAVGNSKKEIGLHCKSYFFFCFQCILCASFGTFENY